MKRVCSLIVAAGVLVAGAAQAQSLADVAKQEQERRKAITEPARVYTDADALKAAPLTTAAARPQASAAASTAEGAATGSAAGSTAAAEGSTAAAGATAEGADVAKSGTAKGASAAGAKSEAANGDAPKGETEWQAQVQRAREELARSRRLLVAMETQLFTTGLQNATARSTGQPVPLADREKESAQEVERLKADVKKYSEELARLEADARAAGVPPGWVR